LRGLDFSIVQIGIICMECDSQEKEKNSRKIALLENNGYSCHSVVLGQDSIGTCICIMKRGSSNKKHRQNQFHHRNSLTRDE